MRKAEDFPIEWPVAQVATRARYDVTSRLIELAMALQDPDEATALLDAAETLVHEIHEADAKG